MTVLGEIFWVWLAALLTLSIFSFLWRDNAFYRTAEHLYIGVANGYSITLIFYNVVVPNMIDPLKGATRIVAEEGFNWGLLNPFNEYNYFIIIPMMVGALYITRFIPNISWMVRIPIGISMGYYTAIAIPAQFKASIVRQLESAVLTQASFHMDYQFLSVALNKGVFVALPIFLLTIATLIYFFFSAEHKGVLKPFSEIGILTVMVGFGASFGLTVMARISLAIGRFVFLFKDWLGVVH